MQKEFGGIMVSALESQQDAMALVEKLFEVAQPSATYGEPVTAGDYTVITASEVKVGLGYGFGGGAGTSTEANGEEHDADPRPASATDEADAGIGGGGGGGGVSGSRPVAAISIGPEGVSVQPVVDVTKIALALFTTIGAMFVTLNRMKRAGRTLAGD
jgi:uncharacterized spore protein YtfJ